MAFRRVVISGEKVQDTKTDLDNFLSSKMFKTNYPGIKTKLIVSPVKNDTIVIDLNGDGADTVAKKVKDIGQKYKMKAVIKLEKPMSAVKESLDRRLATIFFKYKGKSFPMDYKPGSMFSKFIGDLETSGYFSNDDEISDFMSSEEFDTYANKFNVKIDYADYDPTQLELPDEEPINPQDLIPGRAPQGFIDDNIPHRVTDLIEKLKKTGKLKKSELTEIIKTFNK
jgi:hypothetical protein